jgi:hypothetical protein
MELDGYANCHSNSYEYTDSYAYLDAHDPAETNPDDKATSDTATASIVGSDKWLLTDRAIR